MMRRPGRSIAIPVAFLGILLLTAAAPAPRPPAPQSSREGPLVSTLFETATSDLVLIEFWATDEHGAPLSGLKEGEIELIVDGYRRPIQSLEPVLPAARHPRDLSAPNLPPPEVAAAAPAGRRVVLFFDDALSAAGGMTMARRAAIQYVTRGGAAGDLFAVATSGEHRRFRILQDFSADRSEVIALLERSLASTVRISDLVLESEREDFRPMPQDTSRIKEQENKAAALSQQATLAARASMHGLEALVATLAAYKGPKAIVYFGEGNIGLPIELESLGREASAAQVTVHGATTEGLVAGGPGEIRAASERYSHIASLVDRTGGLRTASNDVAVLFRQVDAADDGAYVLSFVPTGPADGRPHSVRLACKRPLVSLRYRHQFQRDTPAQARTRALQAAFVAPEMHRALGVDTMIPAAAEGSRDLLIYIPAHRLLFVPGPGAETAQVEVGAVALDDEGKEVARFSRRLGLRRSRDDAAAAAAGINLRLRRAIPPEARSVTAVVSDLQGGALGAAHMDPASESHAATLAGLALGIPDERSLWMEIGGAKALDRAAETPAGGSATGTTAAARGELVSKPDLRGARRSSFFPSEAPVCEVRFAAAPASAGTLRLVVADEDSLVQIQPLEGAEVIRGDRGAAVGVRTRVPLGDIPPGEYVLKIEEMRETGPIELGRLPLRVASPSDAGDRVPPSPGGAAASS
ncbi:MAG TPA: VWA domain-containing protein [Candidatus Polarisedimenticolia bacterium]|nr:VWA domain-containing protein [Candidatus Polarisedimenticolia bacterium]